MSNSFLSRQPAIEAEHFMGREEALVWLHDKLARRESCNIVGEPRIGKTSLLYRLYEQEQAKRPSAAGVWVRLVTLAEFTSVSFWRYMHDAFNRQLPADMQLDIETTAAARTIFDQLDEQIDEFLDSEAEARLIYYIDDFDLLLAENGISKRDLDWLRSLITRYGEKLQMVITSADSLVALTERLAGKTAVSPLSNLFHDLTLGLLSVDDARQLCRKAAVAYGSVPLSERVLTTLLHEAGRHPDLLKVACGHLFPLLAEGAKNKRLQTDLIADFRLDRHVQWLAKAVWQRRNEAHRNTLLAIAQDTPPTDAITLKQLMRLGLVEERGAEVALFADQFQYWLCQQEATAAAETRTAVSDSAKLDEQFTYVPERRAVVLGNQELRLTPLENRLLAYLIDHANTVCTTEALLENVWGPGKSRSVVEKAINRLRSKIEHDPKRPRQLLSARGEGYILRLLARS